MEVQRASTGARSSAFDPHIWTALPTKGALVEISAIAVAFDAE